jgi:parallel beta helix pectate lyase-like protein
MTTLNIVDRGVVPGAADSTSAIQDIINGAEVDDSVYVPKGTFNVDAVKGLQLRTGINFVVGVGGVLKAIPNAAHFSSVLVAQGVHDVSLTINGSIIGDLNTHLVPTGEWGMGISVLSSQKVGIGGFGRVTQCWGDGIYLQDAKDVIVREITSDRNRRNGMSVISVDGLKVFKCIFSNTQGTDPQAGLDMEPDDSTQFIKNVEVAYCQFIDNAGAGVLFGFGGAPRANLQNVNVHDNVYRGCKPISGVDPPLARLLYAACRWVPAYDWWGYPRDYSIT